MVRILLVITLSQSLNATQQFHLANLQHIHHDTIKTVATVANVINIVAEVPRIEYGEWVCYMDERFMDSNSQVIHLD